MKLRLQKFIADCGVCSRRKAEEYISEGRVKVNGKVVDVLGTKIDTEEDVVELDGKSLDLTAVEKIYAIFHKPRGIMTTLNDPEGRPTILEYIKDIPERVYPVGRLDYLSEGLLILTNDGEVANLIMHPRYEITKVYEVKVFGTMTEAILKKLRNGVMIDDVLAKPKSVRVVSELEGRTWLEFRLGEGRNREIRRICEACGVTVDKLKRVAIEGLSIEGVGPGKFRLMSKKQLLTALGINDKGEKSKNIDFRSSKKTVAVKDKKLAGKLLADDQSFHRFRKDQYYDTVKKEKIKRQQKQASFEKAVASKKRKTRD